MNLLFLCTKNQARSPMAEAICREHAAMARIEVRSAGTSAAAARRLTTREVVWADLIVAMEPVHEATVARLWPDQAHKVRVLDVPDLYEPDERELREVLAPKIEALLAELAAR
jgi:protein-tyrosine-phosphatase